MMKRVLLCLLFLLPNAYAERAGIASEVASLNFNGLDYLHRWSKNSQNEFTPKSDDDLNSWRDMLTFNVLDTVRDGDQLADVANKILSNYKSHGTILRTNSKPKTPGHPAEHFIAAVLGSPTFLEATFARLELVDGVGMVIVYSHRYYGEKVGPAMSDWLKENGAKMESALMNWDGAPKLSSLKLLPQN